MTGLAVMGAIVVVTAGAGWTWGLAALQRRPARDGAPILAGLPMSVLVNLYVKAPLVALVAVVFVVQPSLTPSTPFPMVIFLWLVSPVTEEAMKLGALVLPALRRRALAGASGALWTGMAVGIGFGLGEAAYLAVTITLPPDEVGLPWFVFTGFFFERQLTIFVHGVLAAISYSGLAHGGRWRLGGYAAAAALHAVTNLGAVLSRVGVLPAALAELFLIAVVVVLSLTFDRLRRAASA